MKKKLTLVIATLGCLMNLTACSESSDFISWNEEVKLNDNRMIIVTQKKKCEGGEKVTANGFPYCIARETWLTINLPEFSKQPIVWHEKLHPMIINIVGGRLYVVGTPPTLAEYRFYENPEPYFVGFIWENENWKRIKFNEIPEVIYDANMLFSNIPIKGTKLLTWDVKWSEKLNGGSEYSASSFRKRIDPKYITGYPQLYKPSPNK
ncbi:hypothetical protein [Undibacterium sp. TJN19]|uniref:hypothetical protein n=1 Tax=Undibacterium sp. TJN19 TaxID=3413055 RepID=UPI003BF27D8D